MANGITSESDLRKVISSYPKMLDRRILPELDQYCLELIKEAKFVAFAIQGRVLCSSILSADAIHVKSSGVILIDVAGLAESQASSHCGSLYFMVPGVGHGMRVNGQVSVSEMQLRFVIDAAYFHCARAAARSGLWDQTALSAPQNERLLGDVEFFIQQSSFLFIKTHDSLGKTELSPRGDRPGFVRCLGENSLFIPERPGNKVAISLRNILQSGEVELLMVVPGSSITLSVVGHASVTRDSKLLQGSAVNGKRPKLGIKIDDCHFQFTSSQALDGYLWKDAVSHEKNALTPFPSVLSSHMHGTGILGKVATPIVGAVVKNDLKNLY